MKAAIYVRISTSKQELKQQREACRRYCAIKGWKVGRVVEEQKSAWKGPRPRWEQLKRELREMQYTAVVVFRIDRAWRRSSEAVLDMEEFQKRGIAVVSVMEGIDASTPMGRAMLEVVVALAGLERTWISEASKDRLQALRNMGKVLGRPLGGNKKHLVKLTDGQIYDRYLELKTIRKTAADLGVSTGKVHKVVHNPPAANLDGR